MKQNPLIYLTVGALLLGGAILTMAPSSGSSGGGGSGSGGSVTGMTTVELHGSLASKTNVYTGNGGQLTNTSDMSNGTNSFASKKEARTIANAAAAIPNNLVTNSSAADIISGGSVLASGGQFNQLRLTNSVDASIPIARLNSITNSAGEVAVEIEGTTNGNTSPVTLQGAGGLNVVANSITATTGSVTALTATTVAGNGAGLTNSPFDRLSFTLITSASPSNFVAAFINFTNGGIWYRIPVVTNLP